MPAEARRQLQEYLMIDPSRYVTGPSEMTINYSNHTLQAATRRGVIEARNNHPLGNSPLQTDSLVKN